jgi:8-oxo-dGTP pyrophosphatase MutT (NUDIX family)
MSANRTFTCNDKLKHQIATNLAQFEVNGHGQSPVRATGLTAESLRHAAVAITIVSHNSEANVVVTRRSPRLKAHTGQWALPGGRLDEGESATTAALRELHEEVNLDLDANAVLGTLDDYITRSGYLITPVIVWSDRDLSEVTANPDEVASIHGFSFQQLVRKDSPNLQSIPQSDRQVLSMNYLDDVIFAPTAAMLYQFREVGIEGNATRVHHFDQPVFAWR